MNLTQEASRKPNYSKDIEFGKTGEIDFEEYITEKIKKKVILFLMSETIKTIKNVILTILSTKTEDMNYHQLELF